MAFRIDWLKPLWLLLKPHKIININAYDKAVIKAILQYRESSVTEVYNLKCLKFLLYWQAEYQKVIQQIKDKQLEELSELDVYAGGFREYLDIMKFDDQSGKAFIATIYDSDELWQDPEVLDIIPYEQ